jgi:hypothetical protein
MQADEYGLTQPRRIPMTFLHIHDQGLPKRAVGERRSDSATAESVEDALRAHGLRTAAQAMEHQHIDMAIALRVLSHPGRRRVQVPVASAAGSLRSAHVHTATPPDFLAVPA